MDIFNQWYCMTVFAELPVVLFPPPPCSCHPSLPHPLCVFRPGCGRSASIPPILEGDTDQWEEGEEEEDSAELHSKKGSRKR